MVDILLLLWDTKYFYVSRDDTLMYEVFRPSSIFACVDTAHYLVFRDLILAILYAEMRKQNQQTTSTHWCPLSDVFSPIRYCLVSLCISLPFNDFSSPFGIGYFLSGFFRVVGWCVLPVAWRSDSDVPRLLHLPFFGSFPPFLLCFV